MISEEYKFAFIHVPKCGGTSMEKIFTKEFIPNPHVLGNTYKRDRPELYRWAVIRNSWDRIVSCYFYGIVRMGIQISFEEFVMEYIHEKGSKYSYKPENRFFGKDGHMVYITDHITKKPLINFYVNLYDADNHLKILFNHLNIDLKLLENFTKHNPTVHDDYKKYYINQELIDAVYRRYKLEIDLFKFEFDDVKKCDIELVGKNLILD